MAPSYHNTGIIDTVQFPSSCLKSSSGLYIPASQTYELDDSFPAQFRAAQEGGSCNRLCLQLKKKSSLLLGLILNGVRPRSVEALTKPVRQLDVYDHEGAIVVEDVLDSVRPEHFLEGRSVALKERTNTRCANFFEYSRRKVYLQV